MESPVKIVYSSKSWKDFENKISKLNHNKRGSTFEWLCVFYLQIEPRYKTTYKRVLHSSEYLKISKIKKKLGLQHSEQGTDIIGETFEGKLDIIQCKYKDDNKKNISAKDINDPIRIASGREAKKWVDTILVCSNLKGFTKNKTLDELDLQFRTVSGGDFQKLTRKDFDNIRRVIDKKIPNYESKVPREHQKEAVDNIKKYFKKENRGQIIHACGTGKTLTSYFAFRELNPKLTLFAVPSLQLINQTLIEWTKESLADASPIAPFVVCSDKSNEKIGECEPELWLQELGIKVSNKKDDLEKFLKSRRKNKVIFSTYQSGKVLSKNLKALKKEIDLGFFDEAHNTATSKTKLSSYLLFDKNIAIKKRLFMTATPKKLVGHNERIASMDNEEIYGKLIDEITVKEAIEDLKLLNDYKIVTQIVKNDSYTDLLKDNPFVVDKVKLPNEVELKLLSSAITLKKIRKEKNIKNVVSFHGRRNRANAFRHGAKEFDSELNTYYVDGKQSGTERQNILDDFARNPPSLVTNAQCLSEGVNVPSIDAIMFVDPKQSRVDITQAIGRALRKGAKGKGKSFIIIPIVADKENPENIEEAYQQILMVLRAMSEHDGRIVEYFRLVKEGKKPTKNFVEVNTEYLPEEFDLNDFTEKLHFKAWNRMAKLGRRPFEQAREFARSLGLAGYSEWLKYKKTKDAPADIPLYPDRSYKKEWTDWRDFLGNPSEEENLDRFIKEYKLSAKHNNVRRGPYFPGDEEVTTSGYPLGSRTKSLRNAIRKKQLPKWKNKELKTRLGDLWVETGLDEWSWTSQYDLYVAWQKETNEIWPPTFKYYFFDKSGKIAFTENPKDGFNINKWAKAQNRALSGVGGWKITDAGQGKKRERLLLNLGFPLPRKLDHDWNKMFDFVAPLIKKYKGKIPQISNKTGKPYEFEEKDVKRWISKQRERYNKGTLQKERIDKLEKLIYWTWNPFSDSFNKNLSALIDYINKTGIANPPQDAKYKGIKVGRFLTRLRGGRYKEQLTNETKGVLEKLGTNFKYTRKVGSAIYYD